MISEFKTMVEVVCPADVNDKHSVVFKKCMPLHSTSWHSVKRKATMHLDLLFKNMGTVSIVYPCLITAPIISDHEQP